MLKWITSSSYYSGEQYFLQVSEETWFEYENGRRVAEFTQLIYSIFDDGPVVILGNPSDGMILKLTADGCYTGKDIYEINQQRDMSGGWEMSKRKSVGTTTPIPESTMTIATTRQSIVAPNDLSSIPNNNASTSVLKISPEMIIGSFVICAFLSLIIFVFVVILIFAKKKRKSKQKKLDKPSILLKTIVVEMKRSNSKSDSIKSDVLTPILEELKEFSSQTEIEGQILNTQLVE